MIFSTLIAIIVAATVIAFIRSWLEDGPGWAIGGAIITFLISAFELESK